MDYPNDFDTPTFPAGKSIALSRTVAIYISVCFFLIIAGCCFLMYFTRLRQNYPFLISVDPFTDDWNVVAYPNKNAVNTVNQTQIIQEKLVNDFVTNWFTISKNKKINDARWADCTVEDCSQPQQFNPNNIQCAIYCSASDALYKQFRTKIIPEYQARIKQRSEQWTVEKIDIRPSYVGEPGGLWQVFASIKSTVNKTFNVLAFVTIARSDDLYPANMGYYVQDFNSYRMQQ